MTTAEQVRAAVAAASSTTDCDLHVIYVAVARAKLDAEKRVVADLETLVAAAEREIVRTRRPRQTEIGGAR